MFMSFHHLMDTPHSCGTTEDILEKKKHYKSWKSILIMWQLGLHPGTPHSRLLAHVGTEVPLSSKSAHRPQSLALHLCDCFLVMSIAIFLVKTINPNDNLIFKAQTQFNSLYKPDGTGKDSCHNRGLHICSGVSFRCPILFTLTGLARYQLTA